MLSHICAMKFLSESDGKDELLLLEMALKFICGMVSQNCERHGNILLHGKLI